MVARVHGTELEITRGDIASQEDLEAVVNAANAELRTGGGVAGAIHRAAGPKLEEACRPHAPIEPSQAVRTEAFELPNEHVIHVLGPVYGQDEPADKLLAACYRNALALADEHGIGSIGFPAISTGAFGYPMEAAARVALGTVVETVKDLDAPERVRFVLWDREAHRLHEATSAAIQTEAGA